MMFNCIFGNFPCGILGQVWYLIVSIRRLSRHSNFVTVNIICLFLAGPWIGLQYVIVLFPDHTYLLFGYTIQLTDLSYNLSNTQEGIRCWRNGV